MVGDGYCQDEANKIQCAFDGGDCCYSCVNKDFCKECLCLNLNGDDINPMLGEGGQFDHSNISSVAIFLALGPGSPKFLTLLLHNKVSIW